MVGRVRMRHAALPKTASHDRWIISYADFITLLMAFFVVMYSISSVNDGKFRVLSESMLTTFQQTTFRDTLHRPVPVDLGGGAHTEQAVTPIETANQAAAQLLQNAALEDSAYQGEQDIEPAESGEPMTTEQLKQRMTGTLQEFIVDEDVKIRESANWLQIELNSKLLFGSGSARLSAEATPMITKMAKIVRGVETTVRVEGFTDNVPITGGAFDSNWQLSAARAASIVDQFTRTGRP